MERRLLTTDNLKEAEDRSEDEGHPGGEVLSEDMHLIINHLERQEVNLIFESEADHTTEVDTTFLAMGSGTKQLLPKKIRLQFLWHF